MSRNKEAFFSMKPEAHIQRSRFDRSCEKKISFNGSYLIPFYWDEVLPNDTFSIDMATLMRMTTPLNPVMDNANLDVYFFFVPNRLLWTHWEDFITGGNTPSNWETPATYTVPKIIFGKKVNGSVQQVRVGSIADYLGVPAEQTIGQDETNGIGLNALPFRAVYKVFNDWFRDENYVDPMLENDGDSDIVYTAEGTSPQEIDLGSGTATYVNLPSYVHGDHCLKVAKYHDYFTSVLPAPQKGPDVLIPGLDATTAGAIGESRASAKFNAYFEEEEGNNAIFYDTSDNNIALSGSSDGTSVYMDGPDGATEGTDIAGIHGFFYNPGATINALRTAFQLQRYYEKLSGAGRYIEWLNVFFGAKSPDARLQRSEYLGGKRIPINMSQVLQQSATSGSEVLGKTGAYSLTRDRSSMFTKSFVEHGILLGVCCVRTQETYSQGIAREFLRDTHFDYYNPVFANLGNQKVDGIELYSFLDTDPEAETVLGYQEAWAEYRYKPSTCAGYMRPYISGGYSTWTYGQTASEASYDPTAYTIDETFITSNNLGLNRTLAVSGSLIHQFIADIYIKANVVRPMPLYSIPGLADHH